MYIIVGGAEDNTIRDNGLSSLVTLEGKSGIYFYSQQNVISPC
jgi:hypothetical protein